ncbi:DUF397 domain-containing protein [Streptomyces sp. MS19]
MAFRDTKDRAAGAARVSHAAWTAFVGAATTGHFTNSADAS